jgi:hypothetical protein
MAPHHHFTRTLPALQFPNLSVIYSIECSYGVLNCDTDKDSNCTFVEEYIILPVLNKVECN